MTREASISDDTMAWLLEGDPAIRFQVLRDLAGASRREVADERKRVAREGWGRRLLDLQGDDGRWACCYCWRRCAERAGATSAQAP